MRTEFRCAVEVRGDPSRSGPGRLFGTLLRYGDVSPSHRERFADGALSWPDNGIVVRRAHKAGDPIMRAVPELRDGAVVIDAPLPDTTAGRDAAAEIRGGLMTGLSIEFKARRQTYANGIRVVTDGALVGAGLVDSPSYGGSRVEVRKAGQHYPPVWVG